MTSPTTARREMASEERSATPKRLPEDLFAWEKPLKPAKRARVTPTETDPPSFDGPSFQLNSRRRDEDHDVDMHSDSDSDQDQDEEDGSMVAADDDSNLYATKKAQILGSDLPSPDERYGWIEGLADELYVREKKDGDEDEVEVEELIIELDSSDEDAIDALNEAASALRI
ncbi:hypothetical protein PENSPDRAFT_689865 [Peniophora sp. CONT]|nr:hypothetical protein PENSPDRAFT_689865 [Peniophora sp. CONT]